MSELMELTPMSPFSWKRAFFEAASRFPLPAMMLGPRKSAERQCERIIAQVAAKHRLRPRDLIGHCRWREFVLARHEAFWRCRTEVTLYRKPLSYPRLGRIFGGRDHSTIISGIHKHVRRMAGEKC